MEKISIFNYEAFYLDYLEGNLNTEDAELFITFLNDHPELKVNDDFLPTFSNEQSALDAQFKEDLKQISFNETAICNENVGQFFIAEAEKLLSQEKIIELDHFVSADASLRKSRALFAATRIKPDLSITFSDKGSLRKNHPFIIWPYVAFAASLLAFMFYVQNSNNPKLIPSGTGYFVGQGVLSKIDLKKQAKISNTDKNEFNDSLINESTPNLALSEDVASFIVKQNNRVAKQDEKVDQLKVNAPRTIDLAQAELEIMEDAYLYSPKEVRENKLSDYVQLGFQDMKNPIQPVTNRLGDLIDREVDFRAAKSTKKNSGGFYLQIGRFEFSHRKH